MQTRRILSYILKPAAISLLLLCCATATHAQKAEKAATAVERDSIPLFRGVAVSGDLVGLAQLALSSYGQYEAALRVNLRDKYFPVIELGYGKADADDVTTGLTYKTSAPYGRIGVDFNLMKNKHDIYRVYAGFRYAFTSYKFDVTSGGMTDPVWKDDVDYGIAGMKANCHWLEAVVGIDAKIWGPVRLGWSVRYKRRLFHNDGTAGNVWYVPGFGKQGGTRLGGTFSVAIEI